MRILTYEDCHKGSLEATLELTRMIRTLTGVSFTKDIPLAVLSAGNPNPVNRRVTKIVENLESGEKHTNTWIETLPPSPLLLAQGKIKATISWDSILSYSPLEEKEPAAKRPASKNPQEQAMKKLERALKHCSADEIEKLLQSLTK